MNRGSEHCIARAEPDDLGFNEAPIHESGKCEGWRLYHAATRAASMRPRFMNRGSLISVLEQVHLRGASMRPRFMNRGSGAPKGNSNAGDAGFNEAPIHESGK